MINKVDLQSIFSKIFSSKRTDTSTPANTVSKIIELQSSRNLSDLLEDQLVLSVLNKKKSSEETADSSTTNTDNLISAFLSKGFINTDYKNLSKKPSLSSWQAYQAELRHINSDFAKKKKQ